MKLCYNVLTLFVGGLKMLSKIDIQNEIGKGICVYPLNLANIKENSLNLCTSEFAWTLKGGTVYYNEALDEEYEKISLSNAYQGKAINFAKGEKCVIKCNNENYIVLFPQSTTLIETEETLGVGSNIGGTYHSKVGLVSQGLGHIGTMVGPNFCGDSLVAIHNVSDELIVLKQGDSFVSVIFYYLKTKYENQNATHSGHTDKFSVLGLKLSKNDEKILNADWKTQYDEIKRKMCSSKPYEELEEIIKCNKRKKFKGLINFKNVIILLSVFFIIIGLGVGAHYIDKKSNTTLWSDRFWNVFCSGLALGIITPIFKFVSNNRKNR